MVRDFASPNRIACIATVTAAVIILGSACDARAADAATSAPIAASPENSDSHDNKKAEARNVALKFLDLIDHGQYAATWELRSTKTKARISLKNSTSRLEGGRTEFGDLLARQFTADHGVHVQGEENAVWFSSVYTKKRGAKFSLNWELEAVVVVFEHGVPKVDHYWSVVDPHNIDAATTAALFINRSSSYAAEGNYDRALEYYDHALALDPMAAANHDAAEIRYNGAAVRSEEALRPYRLSVGLVDSGIGYAQTGNYDRAIQDYDQALELDPTSAAAYFHRGTAYWVKGDPDRALYDLDQAILLDSKSAKAFIARGQVFSDRHDYTKAFQDFDQATRLDPRDAIAYLGRGIAYISTDDYPRAIASFSEAIRLDPKLAMPFTNRGVVYVKLGDYGRAIHDFDQAISIGPITADVYTNRGIAYSRQGKYDRATKDFDDALRLDPRDADAYVLRGIANYHLGRDASAIDDCTAALKLKPGYALALFTRGASEQRKGDNHDASADIEAATRASKDIAKKMAEYGVRVGPPSAKVGPTEGPPK